MYSFGSRDLESTLHIYFPFAKLTPLLKLMDLLLILAEINFVCIDFLFNIVNVLSELEPSTMINSHNNFEFLILNSILSKHSDIVSPEL